MVSVLFCAGSEHSNMDITHILTSPWFRILAILLGGLVVTWLTNLFSRRIIRATMRQIPIASQRDDKEREQRIRMLSRVFSQLALTLVGAIVLLLVLGELDIDLGPLIAGFGIAGVAVGFGAQSLVKDFFNGMFIILEDQFAVGDVIEAKEVTGRVESFTLRRTVLRDLDGVQHHIPNSQITIVSNHTKDFSAVHFYVVVDVQEDYDKIKSMIDAIGDRMATEKEFADDVIEVPRVQGVKDVDAKALTISILGKTKPEAHWAFKREMKRRVQDAFRREKVEAPHARSKQQQITIAEADGADVL